MRATVILEKYTNRTELLDMVNKISNKNKARWNKAKLNDTKKEKVDK